MIVDYSRYDADPDPDPAPEPWPETFQVVIAVCRNDTLLLDWPAFLGEWVENGPRLEDLPFEDYPDDPGIWRCTVRHYVGRHMTTDGPSDEDLVFAVITSELILALPLGAGLGTETRS